MGRAGLEKSDVQRARDSLIAQSQYPSVDAVRIALGNTGSKSTIHKYLKELEQEQGTAPQPSAAQPNAAQPNAAQPNAISDALQDLVARLAARLRQEADERVATKENEFNALRSTLEAELEQTRSEAAVLRERLSAETAGHEQVRTQLQIVSMARQKAEQQVDHLTERREHIQAELRKVQQALALKQAEVAQLGQEAAKSAAELAHARLAVYEAQRQTRQQEARLEQMREMELDLARAKSAIDAQASLVAELRSMMTSPRAAPRRR